MATWESVNVKHVARRRTEPGALVVEDEDMVGGWEATVAERGAGSRMLSPPMSSSAPNCEVCTRFSWEQHSLRLLLTRLWCPREHVEKSPLVTNRGDARWHQARTRRLQGEGHCRRAVGQYTLSTLRANAPNYPLPW